MRRQELYINGELVDLPGENALPVRLKTIVTDSNNPDARGGTFTYTIRIPLTSRNAQVFEHIDDLQVIDTFNRGYHYVVDYFVDSFLELSGRLVVRGVAPDGYVEGEIYSDDIAWATQIDDKSLRDIKSLGSIPFTGVLGTYTFNHYLGLDIDATPLQFPMVSYGNYFYGLAAEGVVSNQVYEQAFDDFPPSVYYLRVFKAIFQDIGWTVKGKIFDDPELRTYVLPYVGQQAYRWNWRTMGYASWKYYDNLTPVEVYQNFSLAYQGGATAADNRYVAKTRARYVVTYTYEINPSFGGDTTGEAFIEAYDAVGDTTLLVVTTGTVPLTEGSLVGTLTMDIDLEVGQVIRTGIATDTGTGFGTTIVTLPDEDTDINVAINLPDMNQKVFVKSLISFYNLFFDANPETKTINFYQEPDYYKEPDFVVPLDQVVDASKAVKRPPKVFRRMDYMYTLDGDDALTKANPDFANLRISNNSPAAQGQALVSVPFAPTAYRDYIPQPVGNSDYRLSLPTIADRDALDTPLAEVDWRFNYTPRIIKYLGPTNTTFLINGQVSNIGLSEFPVALHWKTLYTKYYGRPQNARGHLLEVSGILHRDQYARLRQKWNVLLAGEIYRLESCDGYDPLQNEEAKLVLIKQV